jgi:biotin carboxyl carrier protein
VNEVPVSEGDEVSAGQVLIVLEAMKMLNNVVSAINGKVMEVLKNPGDQVDVGDPIITVKKAPEGVVGSHGARQGKG